MLKETHTFTREKRQLFSWFLDPHFSRSLKRKNKHRNALPSCQALDGLMSPDALALFGSTKVEPVQPPSDDFFRLVRRMIKGGNVFDMTLEASMVAPPFVSWIPFALCAPIHLAMGFVKYLCGTRQWPLVRWNSRNSSNCLFTSHMNRPIKPKIVQRSNTFCCQVRLLSCLLLFLEFPSHFVSPIS